MLLPILLYGDSILRRKCNRITKSYPNLNTLISNMLETMYQAHGIGIAAPQLGLTIRLFVVDTCGVEVSHIVYEPNSTKETGPKIENNFKEIFINPKIVKVKGPVCIFQEGCLSIPDLRANVPRPESIYIEYFDKNWKWKKVFLNGLASRVVQHEYDHLNGKLFIDYLSPIKRNMIKHTIKNYIK